MAIAPLVFSGLMERHDLTVIAHHAGAMSPVLAERMSVHSDLFEPTGERHGGEVSKPYVDHFRQLYADTATFGNVAALRSAYEFFGPEQLPFGTDALLDAEGGDISTAKNLEALQRLDIDEAERERIASGNVDRLAG